MKYLWTLFIIVPVAMVIGFFVFSQKYKNTFVPPIPTPTPTSTQVTFCKPQDLQANITSEGAAGNIYGTLTIKNISSSTCTIQGNNFVAARFSATNVILDQQGDPGSTQIDMSPNQIVYSQMHFPNGPQCSSGIIQSPVTFTYQISPTDKVTFKPGTGLSAPSVTACKAGSEITQLDVWSISLQPLH